MRRRPADYLIALGFWMQLVLLFLVDWGSLLAFRREPPAWYHQVGFVVVNVVLLTAWLYAWSLWRRRPSRRDPAPGGEGGA